MCIKEEGKKEMIFVLIERREELTGSKAASISSTYYISYRVDAIKKKEYHNRCGSGTKYHML